MSMITNNKYIMGKELLCITILFIYVINIYSMKPIIIETLENIKNDEIIIDNTAAGDSTDEKSSIRFRHNGGTAAMIIVDRVENFSDSANRTGKMTLRTFNDDSGVDALELSNTGKATFAGEVEIN